MCHGGRPQYDGLWGRLARPEPGARGAAERHHHVDVQANLVDALEQAAAAFKKQTGIIARITAYTPNATFSSKMQSGTATGSLAGVVEDHAGGEDFTFGGAGIAADLANSMEPAWHAPFLPGTADSGLVTDSVYRSSPGLGEGGQGGVVRDEMAAAEHFPAPQQNVLMAASLIIIIPVVLLFVFLQRYFVNGLTGAVKG
jgi:hypothetical protein